MTMSTYGATQLHARNYDDDENTNTGLDIEFNHVKAWALRNRFLLNNSKTRELVFRQHKSWHFHLPPAIDGTEQLDCCKLLGVFFQSNPKMDTHVNYLLTQFTQRIYLLKLLPHQGMPLSQLAVITQAICFSHFICLLT